VGLLAFGLLLSLLGVGVLAVALPSLGWALVAFGVLLAVTQVAVGPPLARRTYRR
jgi:hypothetical protein